jgi:hypothetical protein
VEREGAKGVRFGGEEDDSRERERFLKQTSNRIMVATTSESVI